MKTVFPMTDKPLKHHVFLFPAVVESRVVCCFADIRVLYYHHFAPSMAQVFVMACLCLHTFLPICLKTYVFPKHLLNSSIIIVVVIIIRFDFMQRDNLG